MMTNFKLSSKKHLFIIICVVIIVIGMAVGTVCQFISGGFFNYGSEFSSYKCVTINYLAAEQTEDKVLEICSDAFSGVRAYEISTSDVSIGGEIIYKFSTDTDSTVLQAATDKINEALAADSGLSTAAFHEAETQVGGSKVLIYASIVAASAAVAQFIYVLCRYKLSAALAALVADIQNLGLFVALVAITRLPVGIEIVALAVLTVFITILATIVFLDRAKKNGQLASEEMTDEKIVDTSAAEGGKMNFVVLCFLLIAVAVTVIFGVIASPYLTAIVPFAEALLVIISVAFGSLFVTPCVYAAFKSAIKAPAKKAKTTSVTTKNN
jgi:preprotein translocase subunit SecF